jgi:hypothetical protein
MTLHRFPFDAQVLEAKLISFGDYNDRVLLAVDERILGAPEEFSEPDKRSVSPSGYCLWFISRG